MKKLFTLIIGIALINISCTDKKYDVQQPAPEQIQSSVQPTQPTQPVAKSMPTYQYPDDNGIGPVKNITLGAIDAKLVVAGKNIFNTKCIACHDLDQKKIGPPLRNITKKNTPAYIMNYLLNTTEMQKKDQLLEKLVNEYKILMPDQQLTQNDARAVLEYFRSEEK
ncbi:MAG: c-type cytochrome [Ignavibacteriaceae bacterium]